MTLQELVSEFPDGVGYNEVAKAAFIRAGRIHLKKIEKELCSALSSDLMCKISYNPGGIAVSGDHYLKFTTKHEEEVEINLGLDFCKNLGVMYRLKNGDNNWMSFKRFCDPKFAVETIVYTLGLK